jgi:ribosomal subunit interface protein
MDLHVSGRGTRVTERQRELAERKLGRLGRIEPKLARLEVEVISRPNPRQGGRRVEAVARIPRKTFRAGADATDVEGALDLVAEKLERQIRDHHEKRRARLISGAGRVKSARVSPPTTEAPAEE